MGLNDLTLEKLIGEINGYKDKMRTIHEDYGRASQELQDRINVLGYNLNEHLKETKDQIVSTPQRLLNLETKYVSGEVNESEYRQQREEFKALLERNLHSIEEIKSMITVLSHIEARPLSPGEFKTASTPTVRAPTTDDWPRTGFVQQPTATYAPTPLPQSNLRFAPETTTPPSLTEAVAPKPASAPTPLFNASSWISPSPLPINTHDTNPYAPTLETPSVAAASATRPLTEASSLGAAASVQTITAPLDDASDVAGDEVPVDVASVEVVDEASSDDTLMVKVVDDTPTLEGSAAVVSNDTSQLQPVIQGPESTISPNVAPDLAQVSLTPPTQFYKVVCPKCGADVPKPAKVWELKGGKSKKNVLIGLFQCQDCRVKFREALTREIL